MQPPARSRARPAPPAATPGATIAVARATGGRDALRAYRLVVDGRPVARLRRGRVAVVGVGPGRHRLYVRLDWWLRCPVVEVALGPGERAEFVCSARGGAVAGGFLVESDPGHYLQLVRTR